MGCLWSQISGNIHSVPEGAKIIINGQNVGITPLENFQLETGDQTFEIVLEGYVPARKLIKIQEAKSIFIEFRMKKLYNIIFTSHEADFIFVFNKVDTVKGEKNYLLIEEGEHHLEVFRKKESLEEKIIIIDKNKTIKYKLQHMQDNSRDKLDNENVQ